MNSYLLLLFSTSAIDYVMVLFMERSRTQAMRRLWLIVSLVSNFGFLGYFKYSEFITANLNAFFAQIAVPLELPNPVAYPTAVISELNLPHDWLSEQVI